MDRGSCMCFKISSFERDCASVWRFIRVAYGSDVKPDNILLDSEGHAHLADFNVASYLQPDRKLTGRSGTAAYMGTAQSYVSLLSIAPEVYSGVGYSTSPDFFSLGVTFYECVYGRVSYSRIRQVLTVATI